MRNPKTLVRVLYHPPKKKKKKRRVPAMAQMLLESHSAAIRSLTWSGMRPRPRAA